MQKRTRNIKVKEKGGYLATLIHSTNQNELGCDLLTYFYRHLQYSSNKKSLIQ